MGLGAAGDQVWGTLSVVARQAGQPGKALNNKILCQTLALHSTDLDHIELPGAIVREFLWTNPGLPPRRQNDANIPCSSSQSSLLPQMSRDVVVLCHQILLLQPALVCQVQTVTSQGDFLFGQIVPVTVTLSTEDVPESCRICTTF